MTEIELALRLLTEIIDTSIVDSQEYEDAINAMVELKEKHGKGEG